jgi:hypothetical protein
MESIMDNTWEVLAFTTSYATSGVVASDLTEEEAKTITRDYITKYALTARVKVESAARVILIIEERQ